MRYIYILLIFLFLGCDNFLDQSPRHNLTLENAVTNYQGALNMVNGMYSVISVNDNFGGAVFSKLSAQGGFWDNKPDYYMMAYREGGATETDVTNTWRAIFSLINSCNATITALTNLADEKYPSVEEKNNLLGQAKCLRAWANIQLLLYFSHWWSEDSSEYGILYRDEMANLTNLQVGRLTVGESYDKIYADLNFAMEWLADYTNSRYVSKQLAQILKIKLQLYRGAMRNNQQELEDALVLLETIKTTAPAGWKMEEDIVEMYKKGWDSQEVLWARYLGDHSNTSYREFTYSYDIGYNGGFHTMPSVWLENNPRYLLVMDSVRAPETWDSKEVWAPVKLYHGGRYATPKAPYTAYYFRYAEIYLIESEIKARLERFSIEESIAPLNEMRAKRTNPKLPPLQATSRSELLKLIFQEIWVELFLENGSEYFAALRFINDTDESSAQGKPWIYTLKQDVSFTENQYCWPIPEAEREKNKLIEQNPELEK